MPLSPAERSRRYRQKKGRLYRKRNRERMRLVRAQLKIKK